ncbi:anti-sigma factor [Dyadobacter sp. CY312]|uniref:anti-sigma factor n=1 Tax=Dyadobacter sp. CY312 TaxID=2907303 RepID=UPI001F2D6648|nr:anti-sigma factor [Dyadobacter sp. CY312]MCE7042128.1 anti-sigma factor [Dyadobacter sp. CY312]
MMDPSETDNFNNQWKKAFENASETPPPSVWEGIEARLDRDENDIIPLWWRTPKLWYAAASIIALLVVGGGFWLNNKNSGNFSGQGSVEMASKQPDVKQDSKNLNEELSDFPVADTNKNEPFIAKSQPEVEKSSDQNERVAAIERKSEKTSTPDKPILDKINSAGGERAIAKAKPIKESDLIIENKDINEGNLAAEIASVKVSALKEKEGASIADLKPQEAIAAVENEVMEINALTPMPYNELAVYMQKRYVFFKPEIVKEEKLPELKKSNEYWAGVGIMPATFNPDVQIKEAPTAFSALQNSRQKSLNGTNKAGNSFALQTQGGMRLSKHWSVEMGLSYLKGNSQYEGGGYVLDPANARSTNVLENAMVSLSDKAALNYDASSGGFGQTLANTVYIEVSKNIGNNYQYLQLPLQAGFTLNPDKKLSYSVLGGMMANFFLSNELETASGDVIRTTASDEVYRSLNWAATTGLRLNYKLATRWKASLMGSYQRAVSSGFRANQSMESHPYLYGVSWGMLYSF